MEKWKVFYHNGKELCAYTLNGSFEGEEEATKALLAEEYKKSLWKKLKPLERSERAYKSL